MEKTFLEKLKEGLQVVKKYFKDNYLSYIVFGLTIILFVLLILPASEVVVTGLEYRSNQHIYELIRLTDGETYRYTIANLVKGDAIQNVKGLFVYYDGNGALLDESIEKIFGVVYFPNNIFVGLGLVFIFVSMVLMLFPKLVMRIVASVLGFLGALLQIFLFFQVMYLNELPITEPHLNVEASVKYLVGPFFYIVLAFVISGLIIYITSLHIIETIRHKRSETERYLRGGV